MGEKKRKVVESVDAASATSFGERIEPTDAAHSIDTSNWPLLLKVSMR